MHFKSWLELRLAAAGGKRKATLPSDTHLPDDALDELVHGESDISMDGEHLSQGVLILGRLHVAIQKVTHHLQEG